MKYDELTKRLAKYLLGDKKTKRPALIDPLEQGRLFGDTPKPINVKWQLADKRNGRPKRFTRSPLALHVHEFETYYYRSNRASGFALVMLDIDAHEGQTDAQLVAEHITQRYFPGAYFEPSTGGRGRHVYVVIAFNEFVPRAKVNGWLRLMGHALRELMISQGFLSTVDPKPCRTFSEWGKDAVGNLMPLKMGHLAKIPRPRDLHDMDRIESAPWYLPSAVETIIADYNRLRASRSVEAQTIDVETIEPPAVSPAAIEAIRTHSSAFKGMDPHDPRSRAVHAVMALSRRLGRLPSTDEAHHFYCQSGLATVKSSGDSQSDIRRRMRRLTSAIDYVGKTFDPSKGNGGFNLEILLPVIHQHVKAEHSKGTKYKYGISDEDLAVGLYVIELASFERKDNRNHQWTVPNSRIEAMFRKLRDGDTERSDSLVNNTCVVAHEMKVQRGCNREKAVAIKLILERAGLVECIDSTYVAGTSKRNRPDSLLNNTCVVARETKVQDGVSAAWGQVGYEGRGKRYAVGPNHPRRAEWDIEYEALAEWVGNRNKAEQVLDPMPTATPQPMMMISAPRLDGEL